ncbi:BTAD domain-containing putative transcriptional regulator [Kutzneria sp. NPDC052558]|uniref:AfsR/SARP family transcriptional regulator n=1 Tax=Kutzneria sp. NPDC052558 TaxID=3364121 RepID=UPI0037C82BDD
MAVEFRVLGAVEAVTGAGRIELGHARQRCVLAVLLMEANRLVTADQLLERAWRDRRPRRDAVYSYVSRLRSALMPATEVRIERRSGGYLLAVDESLIDAHRFHALVARARRADNDEQTLALLDEARNLWRGPAFADLDTEWLASARAALEVEREAVENEWTDVALRCGRHERLVPTLTLRTGDRPLDERAAGQLMLALYRGGRQAEAVRHYHVVRAGLADELGTDPGPELQDLYQRILTTAPDLDRPSAPSAQRLPAPRQLPPAPADFIGRADELATLTSALEAAIAAGRAPVIFALAGAGGMGKTWLALHWAHHQLDRFPDGQLFVDLRGFSPGGEPVAVAAVAREFLAALGVAAGRIPPDLTGRTAMLRDLLADRRMLIVLDNAEDAAEVTPLLPGASASAVVVTSRRQLTGLVVRHGARHLVVDVLAEREARELVTTRLGADRVAAEPEAVVDLLQACAGMPLALGIVCARAQLASGEPLSALAAQLRDEGQRLTVLRDEDPEASLPAVLSWSARALPSEQAAVFALLGLAPGPDIGLAAAASLTGGPHRDTGVRLAALAQASLVERTAADRYRMHDLVRLYARDSVSDDDVRRSALRRVTDFYLHTAYAANRILTPHALPLDLDPPVEGCVPQAVRDNAEAMAWFDAEHACLMATQQVAADHGWHRVVWLLTRILNTYHIRRGRHGDELASCRAGLTAARRLEDVATVITATRRLGDAFLRLGEHDAALTHLHQALALAEDSGNPFEQAQTHRFLSMARAREPDGRREALEHAKRALDLYRAVDFGPGVAEALNLVAWQAAHVGEHEFAREQCLASLPLYRSQDNRDGLAAALDSLGYIDAMTGRHADALANYEQALGLFRTLGNDYQVADTLEHIGALHAEIGQPDQARTAWREAEILCRAQGRDADSDRLRRQIADLG